jgi:uncharacterized protein (DUF983 family)
VASLLRIEMQPVGLKAEWPDLPLERVLVTFDFPDILNDGVECTPVGLGFVSGREPLPQTMGLLQTRLGSTSRSKKLGLDPPTSFRQPAGRELTWLESAPQSGGPSSRNGQESGSRDSLVKSPSRELWPPDAMVRIHYHLFVSDSRPSALRSIFGQLCPRCRSAQIFRSSIYWGFPKMHDFCPVCGLHFNREPGYFLGAMYISYGLGLAFIAVLGAGLWELTHWRLDKVAIWAVLMFLPIAPMLTFFSRVLWIYLDQKIDPESL